MDEAPGSRDLSPSEYPCCSAEFISPAAVRAQQRTCLNSLSHVSCRVNQPPLERVILGSSSVITVGIPVSHRHQPGHVHLLQHQQRASRTLQIWQKGLTRNVCETGKEAQGTVM